MAESVGEESMLTLDQLCVAEKLDDVARNGRAIRAVLPRWHELSQPVEEILAQMQIDGLAECVDVHGNHRLTPTGRKRLTASQNWEFEVSDVFKITGRSVPMAMGTIVTGVIRREDWFRNSRAGTGIVKQIEFARIDCGESVVLGCDGGEVLAGDRLTGWIPMA